MIDKFLKIFVTIYIIFSVIPASAAILIWPTKIEKVDINAQASGWLKAHEEMGGHTIERHVNKSDGYLKSRIQKGRINEASTFISLNLAEQIIAVGLWQNIEELAAWMDDNKGSDRLVIEVNDPEIVGKGIRRGEERISNRFGARIVLQKTKNRKSAYILTAYPNKRRAP